MPLILSVYKTTHCFSHLALRLQDFGNSKITQFDQICLCKEYVHCFYVPENVNLNIEDIVKVCSKLLYTSVVTNSDQKKCIFYFFCLAYFNAFRTSKNITFVARTIALVLLQIVTFSNNDTNINYKACVIESDAYIHVQIVRCTKRISYWYK